MVAVVQVLVGLPVVIGCDSIWVLEFGVTHNNVPLLKVANRTIHYWCLTPIS